MRIFFISSVTKVALLLLVHINSVAAVLTTVKKNNRTIASRIVTSFASCLIDPEPNTEEKHSVPVFKTQTKITIDGNLSDPDWAEARTISGFWEKFPDNKTKAAKQTEVKVMFDNNYLYISAVCHDTGSYIIQSLKRDRSFYEGDAFAFIIDPFNKKTMAYYFAVTPYNTQSEDFIINNLFEDPNLSWDNKWFSATKVHPGYWVAEIAIPFTILKYDKHLDQWGINFFRNDRKANQIHSWVNMPLQFKPWDVGYTGTIQLKDSLPQPGKNLFFNPYLKAGAVINKVPNSKTITDFQAGLDIKTTIRRSMSLDVTINPDFSQVEVDKQQTNLTRYNLFFPERRGFFIENNDIFSNYAGGYIQPFYSRSIGLSENGNPLPIYGGIKLSGNVNENLRAGVLNVLTKGDGNNPAQNYSAVSLNRKVLKRSLLKGYFFNHESLGKNKSNSFNQYGRNTGIEFNYSDMPGKWNGWAGFHRSIKPGIQSERDLLNAGMAYNSRRFSTILDYAKTGTNYYADMGFVSRLDNYDEKFDSVFRRGFYIHYAKFVYNIYPKKGKIYNHKFENSNSYFANPDYSNNELFNAFRYCMVFRNSSEIRVRMDHQVVWLQAHTSFIISNNREPLPPGRYQFINFTGYYRTDARKKLSGMWQYRMGQFYNGRIQTVISSILYRVQPWGNFAVDFEYNRLIFPKPYGKGDLMLISPRAEINFTTNLFWTTFLQYNTQRNNFNINSRFQWRFKPMSDLYIVYTDNYYTNPFFRNKNRALVVKLNYWLNK